MFIDVQIGHRYNIDEINEMLRNAFDIKFCRIDELEINEIGESSCK